MRKGIAISMLGAALAAGCGGGGGAGGGGGGAATSGGESAYAGPIGSTDVALGQQRYEAVCAGCHTSGAPQLENIGWSAEHMRRQIREGEGSMPPIRESRLSAADMESVLAYLQSIGAVAADGATPATH